MRRPVIRHFFESSKSIPVERAQDLARVGTGTVAFTDHYTVVGDNTSFKSEFRIGDSIKFIVKSGEDNVED